MHRVTFLPSGLTTRAPAGATILDAANWAGVPIDSVCGGRGTCGKCGVKIVSGAGTAPVLACRTSIIRDSTVEVPIVMGTPRAAVPGRLRDVVLCPNVHKVPLTFSEPLPDGATSDLGRLTDALRTAGYDAQVGISVLQQLPRVFREFANPATAVVCGDECIAIEAGDTAARTFGLALDIGTTSVAGAIVNLSTGAVEATASLLNSQVRYGADVIARISHAAHEGGVSELQACVTQTISDLTGEALAQCEVRPEEIYEVVAVGNATMLHLLLGIDPSGIGVSPFVPAFRDPVTVRTADLGLRMHPEGRLTTLAIAGAYVGADILAGLLATDFLRIRDDKLRLFVDVGTNGEMAARRGERCVCAASPAGPAFEGAQIQCGMRATEGAIEHVKIDGDVRLGIIGGNQRPSGICGSGLIDAIAELRRCGLIDESGRFAQPEIASELVPEALAKRMATKNGRIEFRLSDGEPPIVLTQADVRALQYAKAAVAAGTDVLLSHLGARAEDVEEVLLAGAFGSYLDPASARAIGLVPTVPLERIRVVGNAAGQGAILALLSRGEREAARQMPKFLEYVELSGNPGFTERFTKLLTFPGEPSSQ